MSLLKFDASPSRTTALSLSSVPGGNVPREFRSHDDDDFAAICLHLEENMGSIVVSFTAQIVWDFAVETHGSLYHLVPNFLDFAATPIATRVIERLFFMR